MSQLSPIPKTPTVAPQRLLQATELAREDMRAVDALIRDRLASDVVLINQVAEHIVSSGGKRLRPILVLLAARAAGYQGKDHVLAAAIIEFIHTATLLHDDVVDDSDLRRGRSTANAIWGNSASILVGDFLYSRAFQLMVELQRMRIMQVLADTTNAIAEGEVLQLMHLNNPDTDEQAYLGVIERKTAVLFGAATRLGGILADVTPAVEQGLATFGLELGFAFQIADDVLDYVADAQSLGKNLGDDLAEGKATMPVIHAMAHAATEVRQALRQAIQNGDVSALPAVVAAIKSAGSLDYAQQRARTHADRAIRALDALPESRWREALAGIARYAIDRDR